jgi:hypothetical protein
MGRNISLLLLSLVAAGLFALILFSFLRRIRKLERGYRQEEPSGRSGAPGKPPPDTAADRA